MFQLYVPRPQQFRLVDVAELRSGQVIHEGDKYWYAWRDPNNPGLIGTVDRGEIDYIIPSAVPGVVTVVVRFDQESRHYQALTTWSRITTQWKATHGPADKPRRKNLN